MSDAHETLRKPQGWTLAALLLLTAALYAPWLGHAFIWDDLVQISENSAVRDGVPISQYFTDRNTTSLRAEYNTRIYRPLRNLALRGIWRLSDAAPAHRPTFFLATNLALYLLGGWLVFVFCLRLSKHAWASVLATGFWLLLPVHAEDVLYASALGDLLSFDLQLGGLLYALRAIDADAAKTAAQKTLASILSFVLAVFVKEMAITSVLLLPVLLLTERRSSWRSRRALILVASYASLGLAYLAIRTLILGRVGQDPLTSHAFVDGVVHLPWLLLVNLKVAIMPLGHAPDYGAGLKGALGCVLGTIGVLVLFAAAWWRPARGLLFGALLFFIALLPVLQLVPVWTLLADRFLLVPSIGIALIVAALATRLRGPATKALLPIFAFIFLIYGAALKLEERRFEDDLSFFAYAVATVPYSPLAQHNYGFLLLKQGDVQGAMDHLLTAVELGRRHPLVFFHLGSAFEGVGRFDDAERATNMALERDPELGAAYALRASLQRRRGDLEGAERSLLQAEHYHTAELIVLRARSALLLTKRDLSGALAVLRRLNELVPDDQKLWSSRARLAARLGDERDALEASAHCPALSECNALQRRPTAQPKP